MSRRASAHHRPNRSVRPLLLALALPFVALAATACEPIPVKVIPTPDLAKVTCTTTSTRSITVAASIATHTRQLLAAAKTDGLKLCGGGYRSSEGQIAVRKTNCGTSYYDIYLKPSSECTPPTAIPGTSMHEKGLAIDFEVCQTHDSACYTWLAKHAATYGFKNLPSEPWHWSTTGS